MRDKHMAKKRRNNNRQDQINKRYTQDLAQEQIDYDSWEDDYSYFDFTDHTS